MIEFIFSIFVIYTYISEVNLVNSFVIKEKVSKWLKVENRYL